MGRAHRPSAIRHRPGVTFGSSLPIHRHARNAQDADVQRRVRSCTAVFPVFADTSKRACRDCPARSSRRRSSSRSDRCERARARARARERGRREREERKGRKGGKKRRGRERELPGGRKEIERAWREDRPEKRAGSRPARSVLLSLTEVPNTCGITARAKYIVGEEKRKYLARERTRKIEFYCSLPACRPFVCTYTRTRARTHARMHACMHACTRGRMHVRSACILRKVRSIRSPSRSRALVIAAEPAETEGKKSAPRVPPAVIRFFHIDSALFAAARNLSGEPRRRIFRFRTSAPLVSAQSPRAAPADSGGIANLHPRNRTPGGRRRGGAAGVTG